MSIEATLNEKITAKESKKSELEEQIRVINIEIAALREVQNTGGMNTAIAKPRAVRSIPAPAKAPRSPRVCGEVNHANLKDMVLMDATQSILSKHEQLDVRTIARMLYSAGWRGRKDTTVDTIYSSLNAMFHEDAHSGHNLFIKVARGTYAVLKHGNH